MPIYEYRCEKCGHELDALQKISDPLLKDCPECQSVSLRKLVSAPNFRLKGSGWYETDFKGETDNKRNLHGSDSEAKSDGGDKKDSKGEAAKDSKSDSDSGKSTAVDTPKEKKAAKSPKSDKSGGGTSQAEASS